MSENDRIFVTGIGMISPLGLDTPSTWSALVQGKSGIDYITAFDAEGFDTRFAAEVKGFDPEQYLERKEARRMDRFAQFAAVAAQEACRQANLDPRGSRPLPHRSCSSGAVLGALITLTQQEEVRRERGPKRVSPFVIPMMLSDMASAQVSMVTGAMGANYCVVSSCSSGADALGQGLEMIRRGQVDVVLAGGSEAPIVPIAVAGFNSLRALSRLNEEPQRASRPFSRDRDGFVIGEGSTVLVLESEKHAEERGAPLLAELCGYGASSDAHHLTEPNPTAQSAAKAMKMALQTAAIDASEVDYVNAHGTSTPLNDFQETKAIKLALGEEAYRVPISSSKSMDRPFAGGWWSPGSRDMYPGHAGQYHSSHYKPGGPGPRNVTLDYTPLNSRSQELNVAMSNSFGFGGHNSVSGVRQARPASLARNL